MTSSRRSGLLYRTLTLDVPHGFRLGLPSRWFLVVDPMSWERPNKGGWPSSWEDDPAYEQPIYRYWSLGPLTLRRTRP